MSEGIFMSADGDISGTGIVHLNGIPWREAPIPRRWHRCQVQSRGLIADKLVSRCACGAIQYEADGQWDCRNSRRKK